VIYAVLIALGLALSWVQSQSVWASISLAFSGATALQLALAGWFYFGWRHLWKWIPSLNHVLFPDIGGKWDIEINWNWKGQCGVVFAEATIRQDFLRVSMEVTSPNSDSQTLVAHPKKDPESGTPFLYYVYLVTPKALGAKPGAPYHGAAILKFTGAGGAQLRGNYWTSQRTDGHFRLVRRT
jgi:hypothetical protein